MTVRRTIPSEVFFHAATLCTLTLEELLLELSLGNLNLHGLVDLLLVPPLVIGIVLDGSREQGVDERRLSQARLASNLEVSLVPTDRDGIRRKKGVP